MTKGQINLKLVTDRLGYVDHCLDALRALPMESLEVFQADLRNPASAESFLRRGIEALIDVARHLLAKGYGLASLDYREVARLAAAKELIEDREVASTFEQIAGFRNRLTHYYSDVTTEELFGIVTGRLDDLKEIAEGLQHSAGCLARGSEP